ncbi:MAG: hypothetical protein P8Z30_04955 [Acidobacteriota bacterium]
MRKFSIAVIVGTFLLSACSMTGSLKSKQAIQGAIETHLRNNPHLSLKNFDTQVESVQFKDDTAEALAKFVSKEAPHSVVEVRYQLKLEGRMWKVVSSQPAGGQGMGVHGGAMGGSGSMGQGGATGAPSPSHEQSQPAPESSH